MIKPLLLALSILTADSEPSVCPPSATCIALAVFSEARGESINGQLAVANVVMNRGADPCAVIESPYQFAGVYEWAYPRRPERIDAHAWGVAIGVAHAAMDGYRSSCADATHFHERSISPAWIGRDACVIGRHAFYNLTRENGSRIADVVPSSAGNSLPSDWMDAVLFLAAQLTRQS